MAVAGCHIVLQVQAITFITSEPCSSETKIIDANNVHVLHAVIGEGDNGTVENVDGCR